MEAADFVTATLPSLLELLHGTDICDLELREGDLRVRLHRSTSSAGGDVVAAPAEEDEAAALSRPTAVTSPLVGTFYRATKPGMPPLVAEGSWVDEDTVVGIVEQLHVLTEVEARCSGVVTRVLATDGQPVEYGQPLFEVRPGD